jgi:hypothetical protein
LRGFGRLCDYCGVGSNGDAWIGGAQSNGPVEAHG